MRASVIRALHVARGFLSSHFVACPRSENGFLHAQDAVALFYEKADAYFVAHGTWPRFEDAFQNGEIEVLTLPTSERHALLQELWARGVSQAHLMPTFSNVAEALKTRAQGQQK